MQLSVLHVANVDYVNTLVTSAVEQMIRSASSVAKQGTSAKYVVNARATKSTGTDDDYESEYNMSATSPGERVTVMVGGVPVKMLVDSASTCNIINSTRKSLLGQSRTGVGKV